MEVRHAAIRRFGDAWRMLIDFGRGYSHIYAIWHAVPCSASDICQLQGYLANDTPDSADVRAAAFFSFSRTCLSVSWQFCGSTFAIDTSILPSATAMTHNLDFAHVVIKQKNDRSTMHLSLLLIRVSFVAGLQFLISVSPSRRR
eukprot:4829541-Pleurochrysis_carterae.AAC.2